ncbi:MAG: hypothetical protein ACRDKJ_02285 [Actinomycetota bacterium]
MNAHEVSLTGIPHMGRATVIGAVVGALTVAVPVAALVAYFGGGPMSILAAAHVGFFGGMGFGGMLGAVIQADRYERTLTAEGTDDRNTASRSQSARRAA